MTKEIFKEYVHNLIEDGLIEAKDGTEEQYLRPSKKGVDYFKQLLKEKTSLMIFVNFMFDYRNSKRGKNDS